MTRIGQRADISIVLLRSIGLLLPLIVALAASGAHAQEKSENLTLHSANYASFRQLLAAATPASKAEVPAALSFPGTSDGSVPAVVVVHTLAGFRDDNEGWQAQQLRDAGFATLTYDSFAARGIGDLVSTPRRGPPPYASALADAFAAPAALAAESRIDSKRIAILGFSFGGEVVHVAAFERIRAILANCSTRNPTALRLGSIVIRCFKDRGG